MRTTAQFCSMCGTETVPDPTAPPPPPAPPAHPPTDPHTMPAAVRPPPTWPAAIGIVSIVLGSLGALGGCWGMIAPFMMGAIFDAMPDEAAAMTDVFQQWAWWMAITSLVGMGFAICLILVGVGSLKRRPWTPRAVTGWSIAAIVYILIYAIGNFLMQQTQFEAMARQTGTMPPMSSVFFEAIPVFSAAVMILFGWSLPVFLLIWFRRPKIRSEIAGWT